jgi:hypothetical protein
MAELVRLAANLGMLHTARTPVAPGGTAEDSPRAD